MINVTTPFQPVQALLIIDVQADGVTGDGAVPAAASLLDRVTDLLDRARRAGALIVHLQNDGKPGQGDAPGTPGWELHLPVHEGEAVIRKTHDDGFADTPLAELLEGHHVTSLAVCGVMSEMCVSATARTALKLGYRVVLPHDAHATQDIPAAPWLNEVIPAAIASRAAEWALGDQIQIAAKAMDVDFLAPGQ